MPTREVKVGLRADVAPYIAGIRAAENATRRWADRAVADANRVQAALAGTARGGGAGGVPPGAGPAPGGGAAAAAARAQQQQWSQTADAMDTVGVAAMGMGGAIAGGLLLSAKAAIDWESAWAGVTKTVDGSAAEMAELEGELRNMAQTLPASHKEIAGVAEAAGQLGIAREDITSFTKTMIDLGVSTNLSAEEAATSIAQLMNVMQTAPPDVDRVGAALVALGNAGASTERDIMSMAARLSGAGRLIGASEADVLAMANAMSSVGIEAELGGGAMSRTLQKIYTAVKTSGPALTEFAKIAGMSAEQFATAFREDPAEAVTAFVAGLGRIKEEGGNVVAALGEVKIKGTQDLQVLLRLAGAGDLLADSLALGNEAWEQNTALTDEAAERYKTVAAKLQVAKNNIYDLAIQVGDVLLPIISKMADGVSDVIGWLEKMPGPLRDLAVLLTGLGGAALLMGGMLLMTVPRIVALRAALATLAATAMWSNIALHFRILSALVGGPWVLAFTAAAAAVGALLLMNRKGKPPIDDLTDAIKANGKALNEANRETMARRLQEQGVLDLAGKHAIALQDVTAAAMGNEEAQYRLNAAIAAARAPYEAQLDQIKAMERAAATRGESVTKYQIEAKAITEVLTEIDKLTGGVAANADGWGRAGDKADQFKQATQEAESTAKATQQALDDQLNEALGRVASRSREAAGGTKNLGENVKFVGASAEEAEKEIKELEDVFTRLYDSAYGADTAADEMHKSFNDLSDAAKNNGTALTGNTNAAIANREAIRGASRRVGDMALELRKAGEPLDVVAQKVIGARKQLIAQAKAAGFDADEVRKLVGVLESLPPELESRIDVETWAAMVALSKLREALAEIPGVKNVYVDVQTRHSLAEASSAGRSMVGGRTAMASGGYVRGPGGPRDDAIPAWLSNGEYVVNAAATNRHRPMLEHINAGRFAGGGMVGGGWGGPRGLMPKTLEGVEEALDKVSDRLDKLNATLKDNKLGQIRKEAREYANAIKASFMESANVTSLPNVGGTGPQMLNDLRRELDQAKAFTDAIDRLRKAGLNKTALNQLVSAGPDNGGLEAARQLLTGGTITGVNKLMGEIAEQGAKLGGRESKVKFGKAIAAAEEDREDLLAERRMARLRKSALEKRQKALEKAAEDKEEREKKAKASAPKVRTTSTGSKLSTVTSGGTLAPVQVKVTFDVTGTDRHLKAWIREVVRTDGAGSVQKAFGTAR